MGVGGAALGERTKSEAQVAAAGSDIAARDLGFLLCFSNESSTSTWIFGTIGACSVEGRGNEGVCQHVGLRCRRRRMPLSWCRAWTGVILGASDPTSAGAVCLKEIESWEKSSLCIEKLFIDS
jgi:hypothetical protein